MKYSNGPNAALREVSGQEQGIRGTDIERDYERWHVSLSGLQMKSLLKAIWHDDGP